MYMTGTTPADWKISHAILLYKKNYPLDLEICRPIALDDTLAKLWTGMLAECISEYAESFDTLSSSQEGFRRQHKTIRQIQIQQVLTYAKRNNQKTHFLFVDFSSVFHRIDHDRLLVVMHDLGFPNDCKEVTRDLYCGAKNNFVMPAGLTLHVTYDRVTLQGDSLSPLLFLSSWNLSFAGCTLAGKATASSAFRWSISNSGSVPTDILKTWAFPTSRPSDLPIQALKVEQYSKWGGLKVIPT